MVLVVAVCAAMSSCAAKPRAQLTVPTVPDYLVVLLAETRSIGYFLEHDEMRIALDCMRDNGAADLPSLPRRVVARRGHEARGGSCVRSGGCRVAPGRRDEVCSQIGPWWQLTGVVHLAGDHPGNVLPTGARCRASPTSRSPHA